jgi:hypothetical protein
MGDHNDMTRAALKVLPAWQRTILEPQEDLLVSRYCKYPDMAAYSALMPDSAEKSEALPWQYFEKGRQYHYWMLETWRPGAHHRQQHEVLPEENYCFFTRGAEFFFSAIKDSLRRKDPVGALKFAGVFLHANQDPVSRVHSLEGWHGLHWLALDSLFYEGNEFDPAASASRFLLRIKRKQNLQIKGYHPHLLGTSPAEAAFQLYRRHVRALLYSRGKTLTMISMAKQGRWKQASELIATSEMEGAKITADILFTCLSMAYRRFENNHCRALEKADLSLFPPIDAPSLLSAPYGFSPVARGYALNAAGDKVPLRLIFAADGKKTRTIKSGLATGTHIFGYRLAWLLPAGVYRSFSFLAGLHPDLSAPGSNASLRVKFRGKPMWCKKITQGDPAESRSFDVYKGGLLELVLDNTLKAGKSCSAVFPHIVWGHLTLKK